MVTIYDYTNLYRFLLTELNHLYFNCSKCYYQLCIALFSFHTLYHQDTNYKHYYNDLNS